MNSQMLFSQISVNATNLSVFDKDISSPEHKERRHRDDLSLTPVDHDSNSHLREFREDFEDRDEDYDEDESPVSSSADEMVGESTIGSGSCHLNGDGGSKDSDAAGSSAEQGCGDWNKMVVHRGLLQGQEMSTDPLAQLQSALGRNGMLGMKLEPEPRPVPRMGGLSMSNLEASRAVVYGEMNVDAGDVSGEVFKCHLCSYVGVSKFQFNTHMNSHFDHKCPYCDYTSRTEGRLKRHVKDFHSETPATEPWKCAPDDADDTDEKGSKPRMHKCKQCNYVALNKGDFWEHSKGHIKKEKLLNCPNCPFVTEYKHHLEYHLRNHYGSKPFKCNKCNYKCVNKSMLNSHMKSHSNIYQYRCADCNYATKYCHSLKLHLRKYNHKPGPVLNLDGTPNPYPIIDVNGTRRGPRPKKPKNNVEEQTRSSSSVSISMAMMNYREQNLTSLHLPSIIPTTMTSSPYLYHPSPVLNGLHKGLFTRPPKFDSLSPIGSSDDGPHNSRAGLLAINYLSSSSSTSLKCNLCDFSTDTKELFNKHMLQHVTSDNQDLCKLYGISPDALLHSQDLPPTSATSLEGNVSCLPDTLSSPRSEVQLAQPEDKTVQMPKPTAELSDARESMPHQTDSFRRSAGAETDASVGRSTSPGSSSANEYSVIVSSQSCDRPPPSSSFPGLQSPQSKPARPSDVVRTPSTEEKPNSSSPLDLSSSNRSSPSVQGIMVPVTAVSPSTDNANASLPTDMCRETVQGPSSSPARNRRKGKAFKLDRIRLRLQESSSAAESCKQDSDEESIDNGETSPVMLEPKPSAVQAEETSTNLLGNLSTSPLGPHSETSKMKSGFPSQSTIIPSVLAAKIQAEVEDSLSRCNANTVTAQHVQMPPSQPAAPPPLPYHSNPPGFFPASSRSRSHLAPSTPETNVISHCGPSYLQLSVPVCQPMPTPRVRDSPHFYTSMQKQGVQLPSTPSVPHRNDPSPMAEKAPDTDSGIGKQNKSETRGDKWQDAYTCVYCEMAFKDCVMYTMHMGYHGYQDPFTCNMCGQPNSDKVAFFLHIARVSHV